MTDPKIIRIDPVPRQFSISLMVGSRCNYDCMYCPAELHDKTSQHHDLETLQNILHQVIKKTEHLNLQYKIVFTGGEVTTNRNFLPLVEWIKQQPYSTQIFFTSNGSASLKYYTRLAGLVNGMSFSTHSEFMDEKKFFTAAKALNNIMIRPEKSFHVNIMDEYWNKSRSVMYEKFCQEHNISHSVNWINYNHQTRTQILRQGKQNLENI
jgi:organic radical activating enzyme